MSKYKKRKPNGFNKQEEAHHKKIFSQKVMEVARLVSLHESYKLLTPAMLDNIYTFRSRMIRIVADKNLNLPSVELDKMKKIIVDHMKNRYLTLNTTGCELSLYEWAGPGLSLYLFLDYIKRKHAEEFYYLLIAFEDFLNSEEIWNNLIRSISIATSFLGWQLSIFDKRLISINVSFKCIESEYFIIIAEIKGYLPEVSHVTLNGNNRPVYRFAIFNDGIEPVGFSISGEKLGLKHLPPDALIPVYFQSHAYNRLIERLDCADNGLIYSNLICSLDTSNIIWYKGNLLMEFTFYKIKIGYLLVDIVDNLAVVRTFLMLTHFDTPEGDKLHKIIGFQKPDIKFMNLDKISTFVFSDLDEKSVLRGLLAHAGCSALLSLNKDLFDQGNHVSMATSIESFLSKYNEHNEQFVLKELLSA